MIETFFIAEPRRELVIRWTLKFEGVIGELRLDCSGEISSLYVRKGYRRDGYGRSLVRRAFKEAEASGLEDLAVRIPVFDGRENAVAFFKHCGFAEVTGSEFVPPIGFMGMKCAVEDFMA